MNRNAYQLVELAFIDRTADSVRVLTADGRALWIPRSVMHGADSRASDLCERNDKMRWRIRAWKVAEKSLAAATAPTINNRPQALDQTHSPTAKGADRNV